MSNLSDLEARMAALEARMEEVAADATAARHLAAAGDRDLADLGTKVDANRAATDANRVAINANRVAINALNEQTTGRIAELRQEMRDGFERTDRGFLEIRGKLDQTAAGLETVVGLLNTLIARDDDERRPG